MKRSPALLLLGSACVALAGLLPVLCETAETTEPRTPKLLTGSLSDLAPYIKTIEKIRGLAFKKPVASGTQTTAEFRAFLERDLDIELPRDKAACMARALARLGLLPETFDLRRAYTNLMAAQVAAYYDPFRKTFFIVHPDLPEILLEPTIVHELTHALQDQTFGLESRMKSLRAADNEDLENAFRFLAEGEATYVMVLATMHDREIDPDKGDEKLDGMIEAMSGTGREALVEQLGAMKDVLGDDAAAELASMLSSPDYLYRVLFDPYFGGQRAVHKVRRAGGWAAVNELWRNPPTSTEMLMHPEKLARGRREEPVKVAVPDVSAVLGSGYAPSCENTLGELETEILLEVTLPASAGSAGSAGSTDSQPAPEERVARARSAAAGWGGDRWRSFEKAGRGTVVVWKTVWDTDNDAREFDEAIRTAVAARIPGGALLPPVGNGFKLWGTADPAAPTFLVAHLGKDVTLVAGASTAQARGILAALHPSLVPVEDETTVAPPARAPTVRPSGATP